jgi:hypothetical protein
MVARLRGSAVRMFSTRSASTAGSMSPASISVPTKTRSFSRCATSLARQRSCASRQSPVASVGVRPTYRHQPLLPSVGQDGGVAADALDVVAVGLVKHRAFADRAVELCCQSGGGVVAERCHVDLDRLGGLGW